MRTGARIAGLIAAAGCAFAQAPNTTTPPPNALMRTQDVNQACQRSVQLMEAGGVAVPDLQRASAPMIEGVRQGCNLLRLRAGNGQATFSVLTNLRAYISLADAVPKPFPFPEAASKQFAELRDAAFRFESHFRALLDQKDTQLRSGDRDNLRRYAEANRRIAAPDPAKPRVVFFGDSITDGWRLNEYFPDSDFVNRGISGQITGEMLGRMKADVIDLHPAAVLILAGTNDLAREVPLTTIENNYLMIADLASAYHIKVIFASVLPVSDYHKDVNPANERTKERPPVYIKALNDWLRALCAQRGFTYLDYYAAMVDDTGQLRTDLGEDGLHPNPMGYRIMAPLAMEAAHKTTVAPPPPPVQNQKPRKQRQTSK